jgi:hypothetical protein
MVTELKKVNKSLDGFERKAAQVSKLAATAFATVFAVDKIKDFSANIIDVVSNFERLSGAMEIAFGSQAKAALQFKRINEFAAKTPFTVNEITETMIKMKNLGLDPSIEAIKSMGNTASAMGKPLMQFTEAVADAVTGEFERLKEFGIKSSVEGDKVKFTFQGVTTAIGKNADEIQKYLLNLGNTKFAGGIDKQAETLGGQLSVLGGIVEQLTLKFADESGLTQAMKNATKAAIEFGSGVLKTKTIEDIDKEIDSAIDNLMRLQQAQEAGAGSIMMGSGSVDVIGAQKRLNDLYRERAELVIKEKEDRQAAIDIAWEEAQQKIAAEKSRQAGIDEVAKAAAEKRDAEILKDAEGLISRHQTELEAINTRYQTEMDLARMAFANRVIDEDKYQKLQNRIIEKHTKDRKKIKDNEASDERKLFLNKLSALGSFFDAAGSHNEKFVKAQQIAGAAQAFIATLTGQAEALKLGFPLGLIAAAKIGVAGFGFISAIKGASGASGGAPSVSTGGINDLGDSSVSGVEALSATTGSQQTKTVIFNVQGLESELVPKSVVRGLIDLINEEGDSNVMVRV